MPRIVKRALTAMQVKNLTKPGYHTDGEGLRLQITKTGAKSWVFIFRINGREREMGLGAYPKVSLSDARELASAARELVEEGKDPIEERKIAAAMKAIPTQDMTFGQYAEKKIADWEPGWKSKKHGKQWLATIKQHAAILLDMQIDRIGTEHISSVLTPIWISKRETARRLRGRIAKILDAATVDRLRTGDNPARLVGHLEHILPQHRKGQTGHFDAMPWEDVPAFVHKLIRGRLESTSALALEFTILTAARTDETIGLTLKEIDFNKRVWVLPPERTKQNREHRVPLSDRALEIVAKMAVLCNDPDDVIFVSSLGRGLSNMAMAMCLRGLDDNGYTVHGFRSSFRDWAGDETEYKREVAEAALGHLVGDKAEQAYRRGDALERRRGLMQAWADYVASYAAERP